MSAFFTYTVPLLGELRARTDPGISVVRQANSASDRLQARIANAEPAGGSHVSLTDPASLTPLFSGVALVTSQAYQKPDLAWDITVTDFRWLLNRRRPIASYTDVPAHEVVLDLFDRFTSGFTTDNLDLSLPTITITFDGSMMLSDALTAICNLVTAGGVSGVPTGFTCGWMLDVRDLHLGFDTGAFPVLDEFDGDGVTDTFVLTYPLILTPGSGTLGVGYVTYDAGAGPVNETLSFVGGGGTWQYDNGGPNTIQRVTGAPAVGVKNIQMIYSTDSPLEVVTDSSTTLLHEPEPSLTKDWTQVRNRWYVRGVPTTLRTGSPIAATTLFLNDSSMFVSGCKVRIGEDVRTVDTVYNGSFEGADPSLAQITLTAGTSKAYATGTAIRLWIEVNDTAAQADLAAREGGDGIHEDMLTFSDWTISPDVEDSGPFPHTRAEAEIASLTARAQGACDAWAWPKESLSYATRDVNTRVGLMVTFNLVDPPIVGTFKIQSYIVDQIQINKKLYPRFQVKAAPFKFTFEDFMRKAVLGDSGGGSGTSGAGFGGSGSSGGGGGSAGAPEYRNEVPVGAVNGVNTLFTVAHAMRPGSLTVSIKGVKQKTPTHFSETTSTTFTMVTAPWSGAEITVDYLGY